MPKPVKLLFNDMLCDVDCAVRSREGGGYALYLNDVKIPGVMSHHLEYGDGFQRVIIEVPVRSYETDVHDLGVEYSEEEEPNEEKKWLNLCPHCGNSDATASAVMKNGRATGTVKCNFCGFKIRRHSPSAGNAVMGAIYDWNNWPQHSS